MTLLQGRYQLLETLGEGGMGRVYRAQALHLKQVFAVKQLKVPDPAYLKAFRGEAQLLAGLHHPRLPRVVDFFEEEGCYYLVMDFVAGEDLGKALERGETFEPEQVSRWADEVLDILVYLHSRTPPVVVRDLKPSNLIRTQDGHLTLVDFGIARALQPDTRTATLAAGMGTPGYAPPEQYSAGHTDPRSDLYALAATLYHLLTGQTPVESVQVACGQKAQVPPSRYRELPARLEQVLMRALACRLDERFPDAASMRAALHPTDPEGQPRVRGAGLLPATLRQRFGKLGWREKTLPPFDLALEGPGLLAPLLLLKFGDDLSDPALVHQAKLRGWFKRTVYLVLAAPRFPDPESAQEQARSLSQLGVLKRLVVLPLDLSRKRLLDGWLPPSLKPDNDVDDPILNLSAALGSLAHL